MRRARSQLNRLIDQTTGNYGAGNAAPNNIAISQEAIDIQNRLDALQHQQAFMQQAQAYPGDPMLQGGYYPSAIPNQGVAQQTMPSQAYQQPIPQNNIPNRVYEQPVPQNNMLAAQVDNANAYMSSIAQASKTNNANNLQLDTIKNSLEQMSSKLHAINQTNAVSGATQASNTQQVELLKQHYNHINAELQGIKNSISGIATSGNSDGDFEIIRETLNANYRAIIQQLESTPAASIDSSIFSKALEASHTDLSNQITALKSSFATSSNDPDIYAKTLEVSHDDIAKRLDDMHNALQATIAQPNLYVETVENTNRELQQQIAQLQETVGNIETGSSIAPEVDLSNVEMRLEEITRAVVALSLNDGAVNNLERIEARVSDMSKTLDVLNQNGSSEVEFDYSGFDKLDSKLSDIANLMQVNSPDIDSITNQLNMLTDKFDNFSTTTENKFRADALIASDALPVAEFDYSGFDKLDTKLSDIASLMQASTPDIGAISNQLDTLAEKFENFSAIKSSAPINTDDNNALLMRMDDLVNQISKNQTSSIVATNSEAADNSVVLQHLEQIAGAIDHLAMPTVQTLDDGQLSSIEQQLVEISKQLNSPPVSNEISFEPITQRLTGIEEQIGASRDITIELAAKAAEDAVKMTMQSASQNMNAAEVHSNPAILDSMSQVLDQLNQQTENATSQNIEALGAVSQTLSMMVERLGNIETGMANISKPEPEAAVSGNQQGFANLKEPDPVFQTNDEVSSADNLVMAARATLNQRIEQKKVDEVSMVSDIAQDASAEPVYSQSIEETVTLPEIETSKMSMNTTSELPVSDDAIEMPDVPLEPGSGGPDLAALVRQANERRKNNKGTEIDSAGTDFIAAARRAAQAAAQEAGAIEEEIEDTKSKSLFAALPELFAKRKKIMIMGAAALLFVALAVPLASKFFGGQQTQVSKAGNDIVIEQTANQATLEVPNIAAIDTKTINQENQNELSVEITSENDLTDVVETTTDDINRQEINIASLNIPQTPTPTVFIKTEGLDFASAELKEAVQKGEPAAIFAIGKRYTDGIGVEKDLLKASEWYERAANLGFAPAQYIIGNFNEKGLGVEQNPLKAAEWYEQAAKGGNIIAMHNLAVLRATPNAVTPKPDMVEAFKWFNNAADYGVRDSQVNAGIFHTKGLGTEVNLVEAYKWFSIAAKAGDKDASNKRDVVANAIPPAELEVAKALVADWTPLEVVSAANEVTVADAWKPTQAVASNIKIDRNTIAQTQSLLSKIGFDAGSADGVMGKKTRNAIASFQQKVGLPQNGKIDIKLIKALQETAS